jgi:hypothetical protein
MAVIVRLVLVRATAELAGLGFPVVTFHLKNVDEIDFSARTF